MTMVDTGIYGAKRQSFMKGTPRALLRQLIEKNRRASEKSVQKIFLEKIRDDYEMIEAIVEYWFARNYRALVVQKYEEEKTPQQRQTEVAAKQKRVEEIKTQIKVRATQMVLLDLTMGNGKKLRDCTGKDCAKAGGWLTKIAAVIKPSDVVGAVLSETQVRKMWGAG